MIVLSQFDNSTRPDASLKFTAVKEFCCKLYKLVEYFVMQNVL